MTKQFWPVSISGAWAVFVAGALVGHLLSMPFDESSVSRAVPFLLMIYLLLYHAAETARAAIFSGTYSIGWFGLRSIRLKRETSVETASPDKGDAA